MSGLKRRLSRRRSAGPEGTEPPNAAAPGPGDAANQTPAEAEGRTSLLADPAAPTTVLRPGDPLASGSPDAAKQPTSELAPGAGAGEPSGASPYAAGTPHDPQASPYAAGTPHDPQAPRTAAQAYAAGQPAAGGPAQPPYAPFSAGPHPGPAQQPGEPERAPIADLPPGLDPDELAGAPASSARRSRLRKRVAFLRAARELLLRDLGGFVYELHRTAGDIEHEAHRRLRSTKLDRLTRIDAELHELELRLDDVRRNVVVREPGVGGECPECGELFGSDAHYCSHCGLPLTESARRAIARAAAAPPAPVAEPVPVVGPAAAPTRDQPTEELAPVEAEGNEFRWPERELVKRPEPAAGEGGPETRGDAATGSEPAEDTRGDAATSGKPATGAGPDASGEIAKGAGATAGAEPETPGGEAAAGSEPKTPGGEGSAGEGSETRDDATTPAGDAGGEAPGAGDRPNGRTPATGDLFSRVERGT